MIWTVYAYRGTYCGHCMREEFEKFSTYEELFKFFLNCDDIGQEFFDLMSDNKFTRTNIISVLQKHLENICVIPEVQYNEEWVSLYEKAAPIFSTAELFYNELIKSKAFENFVKKCRIELLEDNLQQTIKFMKENGISADDMVLVARKIQEDALVA